MPTLQEVLEYIDPKFAEAPEEVKRKIIDDLKGDPEKIDRALSYIDPKYANAPQELRSKIVADLAEVPWYEKVGRSFGYGAGELFEDVGSIIKAGTKKLGDYLGIEARTPIADKLIELGKDAKEFYKPPKYQEAYDFTGSGVVEEIPSLIGFGGVIGKGAKLGGAIAKGFGKKGLTKAVAENVGAGAGYSVTQLASGDYEGRDAVINAAIDTALGAGGYTLGKFLKNVLSRTKTTDEAIDVLEELEKKLPKEEQKQVVREVKEGISGAEESVQAPKSGESLNRERIEALVSEPSPLPQIDEKIKTPKDAVLFFERNLLGKEIDTPIGLKVKLDKRAFLNLTSGGKKKGFVEGAKAPEESYELIKKGVEPDKIEGFQIYRARWLPIVSDVLNNPQLITKEVGGDKYVFFKSYKINGEKSFAVVTVDEKGNLQAISFHPKTINNLINNLENRREEVIYMAGGLSPGRATSAAGSDAPGELTDSIKDNLNPSDGEIKLAPDTSPVEKIKTYTLGGVRFADHEAHPDIAKEQLAILSELENAEAGRRFTGIDEATGERKFLGMKSSFPSWIPKEYRSKKLINQVLDAIYNDRTIEKPKKAKELYLIIKEKLEEPIYIREEPVDIPDDFYLYSGGPSTQQIKEFFKVPEDPLKNAPPEVAEQAKLARGASLANVKRWILPQYEWLKQDPRTARVYRAAKDYTEGFEKDLNRWLGDRFEKVKGFLEKLPEEERLKIADYIEGKATDISEEGKKVAKVIRKYLDSIYNYAKEKGLNISYRENYFPHIFEGNIRVQVGNEFKSAKTWDEAIEIAQRGIREGKKVSIKAMLDPNIYELKITNPRFWRLVRRLEEGVELTDDEVKELVKSAGIGRRPRYRYVGNLLERKYDIGGYIKDPEIALGLYTFNIIKKIHQDKFLKELERVYEQIQEPRLRQFLEEYKGQVLGYPTKPEQLTADFINSFLKTPLGRWFLSKVGRSIGAEVSPFDVRRGAGTAGFWVNYFSDLGFSFSSAMVNATQLAVNTFPILGGKRSALKGAVKYTRGLFKDQKLKDELFEAGILTETTFEGLRFKSKLSKNPLKTIGDTGMTLFSGVEVVNRVATYGAAKEYGLKEGVKGMLKTLDLLKVPKHDPIYQLIKDPKVPLEKKAMEFAREVVDKTQFRYEKFSNPKLLSGSIGKLIAPYKTFLINQSLLTYKLITGAKAHPRETILFFAVPVLLAGKDGNPALAWTWDALSFLYEKTTNRDLEEDIKQKLGKGGEVLLEGVPTQLGVDIRGAVKLDFPNPFDERFYGRPLRLAKDLYEIAEGEKGFDEIKRELTPRIIKNIDDALDMLKSGLVRDSKGRVVKEADTWDVALRVLGIRPREYYEFLGKKELIYKLDKQFKVKYNPLVDRFVNATIAGDGEEAKEAYREISEALKELSEKIKKSEGQKKKAYLYLYMKLAGAVRPEAVKRRVKGRAVPFSSDRKKLMLVE